MFKKSLAIGCLLWVYSGVALADKPVVLSSIKPIQLLVAAVADDQVDSQLLLSDAASPHHFYWRPSDQFRLQNADLIVWIGPPLEYFMAKPLALLPAQQSLALVDLADLTHIDHDDHHHDGHDQHAAHNLDPHLWLNPANAVIMAVGIAEKLAAIDPENASLYRQNAQAFAVDVALLDDAIASKMQAVPSNNYLVMHDAYRHFEQRYGLQAAASVTLNFEYQPGVKHVLQLQRLIDSGQITCVFQEPQLRSPILTRLIDDTAISVGTLDPLASTITVSPQGYRVFMETFSDALYRCITRQPF